MGNFPRLCVLKELQMKGSRGFGFMTYSCVQEANAAMCAQPHKVEGCGVEPKTAVSRKGLIKTWCPPNSEDFCWWY